MFTHYIADDIYHLKYALGKPSALGREFHNYHEFVLFLGGKAQFISKNIQLTLTPGSLVVIPRQQYHQFIVTEESTYHRLILGFKETPPLAGLTWQVMDEVRIIPHPDERTRSVFAGLADTVQSHLPEAEQLLLLPAAVTQLLIEQKLQATHPIREQMTLSAATRQALEYIDTHFAEELSLQGLAKALNVSVSSLSHHFKSELNISLYNYVVKKRLSVARGFIEQGLPLHQAAAEAGFKDYTGFFRVYKKYYGEPPSATFHKE